MGRYGGDGWQIYRLWVRGEWGFAILFVGHQIKQKFEVAFIVHGVLVCWRTNDNIVGGRFYGISGHCIGWWAWPIIIQHRI